MTEDSNIKKAVTVRTRYGTFVQADQEDLPVAFLTFEDGTGEPSTFALEATQAIRMAQDLLAHLG